MDKLPEFLFDSLLRDSNKNIIAKYSRIKKQGTLFGNYSEINLYYRNDLSGENAVIIKRPKYADTQETAFFHEALLQKHIYNTFSSWGMRPAVPKVFDIFIENGKSAFSMEYIVGVDSRTFCTSVNNMSEIWPRLIFQVALLLYFLQEKVCFDHRDLKYNNVWVRDRPTKLKIGKWEYEANFETVLLDMGFACLGTKQRKTVVNLGEGAFEDSDMCPKEGRDLFQFILSFWASSKFREKCDSVITKWITKLLTPYYSEMAERAKSLDWSYLITQSPEFKMPQLEPALVLESIYKTWPEVAIPSSTYFLHAR